MAAETGRSQTAIVRIWHAFGLQPHRVENFKFSKDPQFVEKVRDIVGLYLNPPHRAIVLWVDEKARYKRAIAPSQYCCGRRAFPPANRMMMSVMGSGLCLLLWMWPAV
jgi:hypothetical protein